MISLLILILVLCLVFALVIWVLGQVPWPAGFPVWIVYAIVALIFIAVLLDRVWISAPALR